LGGAVLRDRFKADNAWLIGPALLDRLTAKLDAAVMVHSEEWK